MDETTTNNPVVDGEQEPTVLTPAKPTNRTSKPSLKQVNNAADKVVLAFESPQPTGPMKKPKFNIEYDVLLSRAYVNVSTSSTVGNGQKADTFWKKVTSKLESLCQEDPNRIPWDHGGVRNRYQRIISPRCSEFVTYLRAAHATERSGWTVLDYLNQANILWMSDRKIAFTHGPCMNVLVDLPKFSLEGPAKVSPGKGSPVTKIVNEGCNPVQAVFGDVLKRPIGRDAAKAEARGKKVKTEPISSSVLEKAMSRKNDLLEMKTATIKIAFEAKNMTARKNCNLVPMISC